MGEGIKGGDPERLDLLTPKPTRGRAYRGTPSTPDVFIDAVRGAPKEGMRGAGRLEETKEDERKKEMAHRRVT